MADLDRQFRSTVSREEFSKTALGPVPMQDGSFDHSASAWPTTQERLTRVARYTETYGERPFPGLDPGKGVFHRRRLEPFNSLSKDALFLCRRFGDFFEQSRCLAAAYCGADEDVGGLDILAIKSTIQTISRCYNSPLERHSPIKTFRS